MVDHVHKMISIPPKYSVVQIVGFEKGKCAISITRNYMGRRENFTGQNFGARGYHVSIAERDEEMIRNYIRHQEDEDRRIEGAFIKSGLRFCRRYVIYYCIPAAQKMSQWMV